MQAPHWPWSQPFFVPVSCMCSRKASSSVVRVSSSRVRAEPFTFRATFAPTGAGAVASAARLSAARLGGHSDGGAGDDQEIAPVNVEITGSYLAPSAAA